MLNYKLYMMETYPFAGIRDDKSQYVVLGIPLDNTGTYRPGTRFAPDKIREAGANIEFYSLITKRTLEHVGFNDLGNIVLPPGAIDKSLEIVERVVESLTSEFADKIIISLGGEHTITLPVVKALSKNIDTLVVFDAHLDLRDEYLGSRLNHSTFLRRLLEAVNINVIHIGSRALSEDEVRYLTSERRVKAIDVLDYRRVNEIKSTGKVYISIDMDVLDPSYAPGVGNPEPLGLSPLQLLEALKHIIEVSDSVVGLDIVEVNPMVDMNDVTSVLAAKIVWEMVGLLEHY